MCGSLTNSGDNYNQNCIINTKIMLQVQSILHEKRTISCLLAFGKIIALQVQHNNFLHTCDRILIEIIIT